MEPAKDAYSMKAEDFMEMGDKKMRGGFMDKLFGNKGERAEEAVELYKQAATNYKLGKRWESASKAYLRCAECEKIAKSGEAAEYLVQAADSLRKINTASAIELMQQAIDLYIQDSRISYAAKLKKTIGEIYEADAELSLAAKSYQEAADLFYAEQDNTSNYNQMMLKVADLTTFKGEGDLVEAIKIYEKIADKYLENKLTAPSARDLFFKSALLHLANDDTIGCTNSLEKYADKDPSFQSTRECKFTTSLTKNIENKNVQGVSDDCFEFNSVIPLDKWKTNILLKIKGLLEKKKTAVDDQLFR